MAGNVPIYFRGENNVKTIFNDLISKTRLSKADNVIMSGGSAGNYYY